MYFASNLQHLRRRSGMTQEKLAQKLNVSRQAISKWESGETVPDAATLLQLAELFSCKLDDLLRQELSLSACPVRIVTVKGFRMARYCVISPQAREDVLTLLNSWANSQGLFQPTILLWRFPYITEEQKQRFSLDGFEAACILPEHFSPSDQTFSVTSQPDCAYALLTIEDSFSRSAISQGIRTILEALESMGIRKSAREGFLPCFERRIQTEEGTQIQFFLQCQGATAQETMIL